MLGFLLQLPPVGPLGRPRQAPLLFLSSWKTKAQVPFCLVKTCLQGIGEQLVFGPHQAAFLILQWFCSSLVNIPMGGELGNAGVRQAQWLGEG